MSLPYVVVMWTGARVLSSQGLQIARQVITEITGEVLAAKINAAGQLEIAFVTGACIGLDIFAGLQCIAKLPPPMARHIVVIPADRSRVDEAQLSMLLAAGAEPVAMPVGTSYRQRNLEMVAHLVGHRERLAPVAHSLAVGLPVYPEWDPRSRRSGTWQTLRMASREGAEARPYVLEPAA